MECTVLMLFLASYLRIAGAFLVTGATSGVNGRVRPLRYEINDFARAGPSFDLYILATLVFHHQSVDDPLGYFQIAGIHGYPIGPWNGTLSQPGSEQDSGYCMHKSILFPIWHRPYLALYEQLLNRHAHHIAQQYPDSERKEYTSAADNVPVATTPYLFVNTPIGPQNVINPLYQYKFPSAVDPSSIFPSTFSHIQNLTQTVRHYNPSTGESLQDNVSALMRSTAATTLQSYYQILSTNSTYGQISADTLSGVANTHVNIEKLHNHIHSVVGGPWIAGRTGYYGHMTIIWMSAFDPVFWLHHASVDRTLALWQAIHPDVWVEPVLNADGSFFKAGNTLDTGDTALEPFLKDDQGAFWSANEVRDTAVFGYTYPGLEDWNTTTDKLQTAVAQLVENTYHQTIVEGGSRAAKDGHGSAPLFNCAV